MDWYYPDPVTTNATIEQNGVYYELSPTPELSTWPEQLDKSHLVPQQVFSNAQEYMAYLAREKMRIRSAMQQQVLTPQEFSDLLSKKKRASAAARRTEGNQAGDAFAVPHQSLETAHAPRRKGLIGTIDLGHPTSFDNSLGEPSRQPFNSGRSLGGVRSTRDLMRQISRPIEEHDAGIPADADTVDEVHVEAVAGNTEVDNVSIWETGIGKEAIDNLPGLVPDLTIDKDNPMSEARFNCRFFIEMGKRYCYLQLCQTGEILKDIRQNLGDAFPTAGLHKVLEMAGQHRIHGEFAASAGIQRK